MFPFEEELEEIHEGEKEIYYPREYGIDFSTGKLTGKIVEGKEAIAVWAYLALHIERYKFYTYSWYYGNEFKELIGKNYSKEYITSEVTRMVKECLEHPYINGIKNLTIEQQEGKLHITFIIETDYGEEEIETDV